MGMSVVKYWLGGCSFKQQTVVLSALRGCDGISKFDSSKILTRHLRGAILYSADKDSAYMLDSESTEIYDALEIVIKDIDKYPMHWLMHFAHACQIVGFYSDDSVASKVCSDIYLAIVDALHLYPESKEQNEIRLKDKEC